MRAKSETEIPAACAAALASFPGASYSKEMTQQSKAESLTCNFSLRTILAYLYAERGIKLEEALSLVNTALKLEEKEKEKDNLPLVKDTKAWVLYKMGRTDEALLLLKNAAASAPDAPDIRKHLQIIQQSVSQKAQRK